MKIFYRIVNDKLSEIQRDTLGFDVSDPSYIPDDYLDNQEFLVMRTCHGLGDWVILSAMPRLLKEKYPDSKWSCINTEISIILVCCIERCMF